MVSLSCFFPDIMDCKAEPDGPCDENADCSETPGGFNCTCRAGWTGDGLKDGDGCDGNYEPFLSSFAVNTEVLTAF